MSAFSFFGRAFLPFGWALGIVTHFPKNPTNRIPKYVSTNGPQQWSVFVYSSNYCEWIDWHSELKLHLHSLGDPAPTSAPSKKSPSRISWMGWNCAPGVSFFGQYYFFFSSVSFRVPFFSFLLLALRGDLFSSCHIWPQVFCVDSYLPP